MKSTSIIFLLSFISISGFAQSGKSKLGDLVLGFEDEIITLEKDLSYYHLQASDEYLVWYEGNTKRIFFQDLHTDEINELEYRIGRGPYEVQMLRDIVLIDNELFILDLGNSKIVRYDLNRKQFSDEFVINTKNLFRLASAGNEVFGIAQNREALFYHVDYIDQKVNPLKGAADQNLIKELWRNSYKFDGPFLANSEYLVSVRYYEPTILIYPKSASQILEVDYDIVEEEPEYETNNFGLVSSPPSKLSMQVHAATISPNSNVILLAMEGKTKRHSQIKRSTIYRYDFDGEKYIESMETEAKSINEIAVNEDFIFFYDEEAYQIGRIDF